MKRQPHTTRHTENLARLSRIEGQVRGIRRLVEEGAYCMDILAQIEAAVSALQAVGRRILRKHLETCLRTAARESDPQAFETKLDEVIRLLEKQRR